MSYNSNDAEQYFKKVIDYVKSQKYNEAIECFKALKNIDPKHVCAWFHKVVVPILADSKTDEEAIQFVDKTLGDKDICIDPVYVLAAKAIVLYHKKSYEKAMEYVEEIQKNTKFDSDSVASLHANLKFDSDSVETLHAKTDLFFYLKRYEEAMEYVDKTLGKDPVRARKCKGFCLIGLGVKEGANKRFEEALTYFEGALKEKRGSCDAYADTWAGKGLACVGLKKNYEEALEYFEKALKIEGCLRYVQINKAIVIYSLERHEEAIKCFDRILESNGKKDDDDVYFFRGQSKCGIGDYTGALEDFNKVRSGEFAAAEKDASIGECYYGLGFYEDAEKKYSEAIKCDPKLVRAYYNLAILYASEDKYDRAKRQLDTCLKIDRNFQEARDALKKLEALGQLDWYRWWFGGDDDKDHRNKSKDEKWWKKIGGKPILGATVMASIAVLTILNVILAFMHPSDLAASVVAALTFPLAILVGVLLLPSLRRFKAAGIELEPVLFAAAKTAKLSESLYKVTVKSLLI